MVRIRDCPEEIDRLRDVRMRGFGPFRPTLRCIRQKGPRTGSLDGVPSVWKRETPKRWPRRSPDFAPYQVDAEEQQHHLAGQVQRKGNRAHEFSDTGGPVP